MTTRRANTIATVLQVLLLSPFALAAAGIGFLMVSSLAAWLFPSAAARAAIGFFVAIGLPALLSLGNRFRFFLKALVLVNVAALASAVLIVPEGLRQALLANGAWPAYAVAPYLSHDRQEALTRQADQWVALLASQLPEGPGALSHLFPPPAPEVVPTPKGRIEAKSFGKTPKSKTAQPVELPSSATVHFKKNGASMIVPVTFNDGATVPMIYDTGASITTLDAATARKLKLSTKGARVIEVETANGTTTQSIVKVDSIEVSGARVEGPLEVAICNTCSLSGATGLLGLNFSSAFRTQIDPKNGTITFLPHE